MTDPLLSLPIEVGHDILCCGVLGPLDLVHLEQVSHQWRTRVRDEAVWHRLAKHWGLVDPSLPDGATLRQVVLARSRDGHDEHRCFASARGWRDYVCLEELIQRRFGQTLVPPHPDAQEPQGMLLDEEKHECVHHRSNSVALQAVISHTFAPLGMSGDELHGTPLSPTFPSNPSLEEPPPAPLPGLSPSPSPSPSPRSSPELMDTPIDPAGGVQLPWWPRSAGAGPTSDLLDPDFVRAVPEDGIYVCSQRRRNGGRATWTINFRTFGFLSYLPVSTLADEEARPHVSKPAIDGVWLVQSYFHPRQRRWALELFQLESRLAADPDTHGTGRIPRCGVYVPLLTVPLPLEIVDTYGVTPPLRDLGVVRLHYPLAVVMMDRPDFDGNVFAVQVSLETGKVLHCVNLTSILFPPERWWAHSRGVSLVHLDFDGRYLLAHVNNALGLTVVDLESASPDQGIHAPPPVWGISVMIQDAAPDTAAPTWTSPFSCSARIVAPAVPHSFRYELTSRSYTTDFQRWWKDVKSFRLDSLSGLFVAVLTTGKLAVLRDYRALMLHIGGGESAQATDKPPIMIDISHATSTRTPSANTLASRDTLVSIRPGTEQVVLCRPGSPELIMLDFTHACSPAEVKVHCLGRIDEVVVPCNGVPGRPGYQRAMTIPSTNTVIEAYATRQSQGIKQLVQSQNVSIVELCGLQSTWASVHLQTRWRDPNHGMVILTHCFDLATTALAHKEPRLTARRLSSHPMVRPRIDSSVRKDHLPSPPTLGPTLAREPGSFSAFA